MRTLFSCETHLKRVFLPILGDVLDLDFILGGSTRGKQFLLTVASIFPVVLGYF